MSKPNKIVRKIAAAMETVLKDNPSDCITWLGDNVIYTLRSPGTKVSNAEIRGTSLGAVSIEIANQRTYYTTSSGGKNTMASESMASYIEDLTRAAAIAAKITEQL